MTTGTIYKHEFDLWPASWAQGSCSFLGKGVSMLVRDRLDRRRGKASIPAIAAAVLADAVQDDAVLADDDADAVPVPAALADALIVALAELDHLDEVKSFVGDRNDLGLEPPLHAEPWPAPSERPILPPVHVRLMEERLWQGQR